MAYGNIWGFFGSPDPLFPGIVSIIKTQLVSGIAGLEFPVEGCTSPGMVMHNFSNGWIPPGVTLESCADALEYFFVVDTSSHRRSVWDAGIKRDGHPGNESVRRGGIKHAARWDKACGALGSSMLSAGIKMRNAGIKHTGPLGYSNAGRWDKACGALG